MAQKRTTQTRVPRISNLFIFSQFEIIVLVDGLAIGPFKTSAQALTWAYEHSRDGIFQLKELINPMLEI